MSFIHRFSFIDPCPICRPSILKFEKHHKIWIFKKNCENFAYFIKKKIHLMLFLSCTAIKHNTFIEMWWKWHWWKCYWQNSPPLLVDNLDKLTTVVYFLSVSELIDTWCLIYATKMIYIQRNCMKSLCFCIFNIESPGSADQIQM